MERLFKSALSVREFRFHTDDDYVDRLSRYYTVTIYICFAFLVTTKQFVGTPINCWCPAQFTDSHVDYANALCWVTNTHYLSMEETIPGGPFAKESMIGYYQWVPMILLILAVLSFMPCQVWRFLNRRSGINLASIMDAAHVASEASYLEVREKAVRYIVNQMDRYLLAQRQYGTGCAVRIKHFVAKLCCLIGGRDYGNYLISNYLVIKVVYLVNAVAQIWILAAFLGPEYRFYGLHVIDRMLRQSDWGQLEHFPRVTLCEFTIRDQSRFHNYVVQCALTINLFNEKIFIFLWFWLVFLACITAIDILLWLFRAFYWPGSVQFVRKRLRAFDTSQREPAVLAKFTESYLRRDGLFIIRLIGFNMGDVAAGEVICGLWNNYSPERRMIAEKAERKRQTKVHQNGVNRMEMV